MLNFARRLTIVALCIFALTTRAQDPPKKKPVESKGVESKDAGTYFNMSGGRFLPNGIYGVRDVYPYWGMRFGHPYGTTGVEWAFTHIHAKGVTFYTGSLSLAFPSEIESWKFIPFVGMDTHYFSGKTNRRELPFSTSVGFHLGFSPIIELTPLVSIRADFKFNFNPGQTLHVGGGLQFNF